MKKKLLSILALLTTMTAWAQDVEYIKGLTYNLSDGYYEIKDAQDLIDLATYVNAGNNAIGKTFKVTQDIKYAPDNLTIDNYGDGIGRPTPDPSLYGGEIYDLSGQRVTPHRGGDGGGLPRGIYIINGGKILIQ